MKDPLAHSARHGVGTQSYREHVTHVVDGSRERATAMLQHYSPAKGWPTISVLSEIVTTAAVFHDLGKLDPGFQKTLEKNKTSEEHIRHEDAGSAWLIGQKAVESAGLIAAHHQGLVFYEVDPGTDAYEPSGKLEVERFRIPEDRTRSATSARLKQYLNLHHAHFGSTAVQPDDRQLVENGLNGLTRRLLLSCLVDADHSDTARHYQNEPDVKPPATRWKERLEALEKYVADLSKGRSASLSESEKDRQQIRDSLFQLCRDADTEPRLRSCDAVVGSGKTTALMAHLLQVAIARDLRHIMVVLPFTNIISQSVAVYRKALCLDGENPEEVVAEHHHQVEFKSLDIRHLTTTWKAPIIVTTAVQFFGTLAANNTSSLRKLHELPGSAVCLDEAHAALPAKLWPVCWNWLLQWTRRWNGHLVLASGSLPEFWTRPEFRSICEGKPPGTSPAKAQPVLSPLACSLKQISEKAEHQRVKFRTEARPLQIDDLESRIESAPSPRIVVVNTVQSAAFLAAHLHKTNRMRVLHLSTALAPVHRAIIVERIKNLLKYRLNWVLVATSLVEAGMDFSFASGFRQRASVASMIQLGGRVNRSANLGDDCSVLDFDFADTSRFPDNPVLKPSKNALEVLFKNNTISPEKPCDLSAVCLEAIKVEFQAGTQETASHLVKLEVDANYPQVAKECQVIQSDTRIVIVDRQIAERIKKRIPIPRLEVVRNSVQMYHTKIEALAIPPIREDLDLFHLSESWVYDPDLLGYMAEPLRIEENRISNGYFL